MIDRTTSHRARRVGAMIVGAYLVAVVATVALSGHRVLPLFEGIGPPPAYQWVHPPPEFSAGNIRPQPSTNNFPFTAGKTGPAVAASADGQFIVNFSAGAFAAHDGDTAVHATVTPLDPATLGPVPPGLAPDGNAYRIQLSYLPSNTPADTLTGVADVIMSAPHNVKALLYSADGQTWSRLPTQSLPGPSTVGSTLTRPGWYLVATTPTAVAAGHHGGGLGTAVIAALVAGLAILLAATPIGIRGLRRRRKRRRTRRRVPPGSARPTRNKGTPRR